MFTVRFILTTALFLLLSGCGDFMDDLNPAGVTSGNPTVSATVTDISVSDSLGNTVTIPSDYSTPIVLYFTMWCPVCDMHTSHMRSSIVPNFPGVTFFLVDYVSSTLTQVRTNEISSGFSGSSFTTLADINNKLENYYNGTMGTTVVIDTAGTIVMNEDYKDGSRLSKILTDLTSTP